MTVDRLQMFVNQEFRIQTVEQELKNQAYNIVHIASHGKVEKITNELASKTLELYEKESVLADQRERYSKLEDDLVDASARLMLIQRIIHEKDEKRNGDAWVQENHPEWFTVSRNLESSLEHPPYVGYYKWVCPSRGPVRVGGHRLRAPVERPHLGGIRVRLG